MSLCAYMANYSSNTVSVIDTSNNTVSATVTVGTNPIGVAVTPDGAKAYVISETSGTVSVIDTSTNTVSTTITLGSEPIGAAITPDGVKAYVATSTSGSVSVIDTATNTVSTTITVGTSPYGIAITPDGTTAYVANEGAGTVSVIDISSNTVSTTVTVGTGPVEIAITPDGAKAYVTNQVSGTVSVINTSTNTVSTTVTVGTTPQGVAITPDGTKAYVANGSHTVSVINTATNTVSATVTVGSGPVGVAITPDGAKAYVANNNSPGTVSVINTSTNTVSATVTVGTQPVSLGIFIQPPTHKSTETDMPVPQGRLTLSSTAPVMTADATAQSTIYYLPYVGAVVPVYDGANFVNYTLGSSGISLALDSNSGHTGYQASGSLFDIFAFISGGVLTLGTSPAWTNGTTRSNAITQVNGIWVNNASITLRFGTASGNTVSVAANKATYLGTMYATANGQTGVQFKPASAAGGSNNIVGLWNAYNRVRIASLCTDSNTSWTYGTATWRKLDNNANNRVTYVDGLGQSFVQGEIATIAYNATAGNGCQIGLLQNAATGAPTNTATYQSASSGSAVGAAAFSAEENFLPVLGLNYLQGMENSPNATVTTFAFDGFATYILFEGEY